MEVTQVKQQNPADDDVHTHRQPPSQHQPTAPAFATNLAADLSGGRLPSLTVRWSEQRQQFVEAVVRTLQNVDHQRLNESVGEQVWRHVGIAWLWLGHLEAANGCGVSVIVSAAHRAEERRLEGRYQCHREEWTRTDHRGECDWRCILDLVEFASALTIEAIANGRGADAAYGRVPGWFDNHARFTLGKPTSHYADCSSRASVTGRPKCNCGATNGLALIVPTIRLDVEAL